ncbi:MAG TPA: Ig-like domain-containing protein, partial [Gemmatimonadales bacterium]|nr:Ig-like domain-containing protein [Gemmatimonadales bacterium]
MFVIAAGARTAAAQTIVAGPATTELQGVAGERLTMPIAVDLTGAPGTRLGAYRLSVRWKPSLLKFVAAGGAAFAAPVLNTDSAAQGVVKWAAANAAGATGFFTLGSVTFEVLNTAQADTLKLAFQEMTAAGSYLDLLPQLSLTTTVFCGGPVWGDMNADGILQALDAQIVLMHAVGIAVGDTTRGDVDADTRVNPRDALIILSKVVALDVTSFRVGKFVVSTCAGLPPRSVTIFPEPIGMAVGDRFTARAEVKDSVGKIVLGKGLAWSSSNPGVATVDSTGTLTAVANGTAILTAAAAPGLTDTTTVTVGARHRWVVNAPGAQGQASEVGSDLYPFSTIKQALD